MLAACNSTFGLHDVDQRDAAYYDAHIDAAFGCPGYGTLPAFQRDYHQTLLQDCTDFTVSLRTGRALAMCYGLNNPQFIADGPIDGPLEPAPGLQASPNVTFSHPRLGADGDLATTLVPGNSAFVWRHDELGWRPIARLAPEHEGHVISVSEPSAGPSSRILVGLDDGTLREVVDDGTFTWHEVASHNVMEFGGVLSNNIHFGADALRMWFSDLYVDYADRASTADPFTPRGALSTVLVGEAFITEDCGRVYFSTLGSVWFAQQQ